MRSELVALGNRSYCISYDDSDAVIFCVLSHVLLLYILCIHCIPTRRVLAIRRRQTRKKSERNVAIDLTTMCAYEILCIHRASETGPKEKKERAPPAPHYVSIGTALASRKLSTAYPQGYPQANRPNIRSYEHTFVLSAPNTACYRD